VVFFESGRGVADLARIWNASGPYYWEIRDSDTYGDYLFATVRGYKVRVYPHTPPRYEIDILSPVGSSRVEEETRSKANDAAFRDQLLPLVTTPLERSTVRLWAENFRAGELPRVSPLSGEVATASRRVTFRTLPDWTPVWTVLSLLGLLTGGGWVFVLLLRLALSLRASGFIHVTPAEAASARKKKLGTYGLLLATIVLAAIALVSSLNPAAPTGLLVVLAVLAFAGFAAGVVFF